MCRREFVPRTDRPVVESHEATADTDGTGQSHATGKTLGADEGGLHNLEGIQQTGTCRSGDGTEGVV